MPPTTPATEGPIIINTLDLTLDQLDEVSKIVEADKAGFSAAVAFIVLRGRGAEYSTLAKCKALTLRQVQVTEVDQVASQAPDPVDPTGGQS